MNGGLIYVDFIDVKPPLIYYISALAIKVFGTNESSLRIMEFLWQSATIGVLVYIVTKHTSNKISAMLAAVVYATLHVNLSASQTYQTESLVAIFVLVAFELATRRGAWFDVIIGFCLACCFLLKYPLAIAALPLVFYWLHEYRNWRAAALRTMRVAILSFLFIGLLVLPIITDERFWPAFAVVFDFLKVYNSYPAIDLKFAAFVVKYLGVFFGDKTTIVVMIGVFASVWTLLNQAVSSKLRALTLFNVWLLILFVVTVVIERKMSPYQLGRTFLPISILASVGFAHLYSDFIQRFRSTDSAIRYTLIGLAVLLMFFSPLPRYFNASSLAIRGTFDRSVWDAYLTRSDEVGMDNVSVRKMQTYLNNRIPSNQHVFVMSMMATGVLPFIDRAYPSVFADPHFYTALNAPTVWRNKAMLEIKASEWLAIDTVDICSATTQHELSSWQCTQSDPFFKSEIFSNFTPVDTVAVYVILRRNH